MGLENSRSSVALLDDDEKRHVHTVDGTPGNPVKTVINEPGLYALVIRSRKPEAKAFKRWITHTVLPEIRRTGAFLHATADMTDEEIMAPRPTGTVVGCHRARHGWTLDWQWGIEKNIGATEKRQIRSILPCTAAAGSDGVYSITEMILFSYRRFVTGCDTIWISP